MHIVFHLEVAFCDLQFSNNMSGKDYTHFDTCNIS